MKNIEDMLKMYRINKSTIRCRELEIEGIEEYLKFGGWSNCETKNEAIEGLSLKINVSETPRSVTNKFSSIVENTLLGYVKDWKDKPPTIAELKERIIDLKYSIKPLTLEIKLIDEVLLPCLSIKEKFIIECLYIDNYSWLEIIQIYAERFEAREERTLKDIRKYAIKKMMSVVLKIA